MLKRKSKQMNMEIIGKSLPESLARLKKRSKQIKGLEYQYLWVNVNFAIARDNYIKAIGARAFGIFFVIRTYMNKEGVAYPSLRTIAFQSGCSIGTVEASLVKLIEKGWLKKVGRVMDKGKYGNTKYQILQKDLIRGTGDPSYMKQPVAKFANGL